MFLQRGLITSLFLCVSACAPQVAPTPQPTQSAIDVPNALDDPSVRAAPPYNPRFWNVQNIRTRNNCYAKAVNDAGKTEYGAMPGERTLGQHFPKDFSVSYEVYRDMLIRGARADGLLYTGRTPGTRPGYYRVALIMSPAYGGRDVYWHWLQQNNNGYWSGKSGPGFDTDRDNTGQRIHNPEKAWFGPLVRVVGYFLVPEGGLNVGNPNEPKTHPGTRPALRVSA